MSAMRATAAVAAILTLTALPLPCAAKFVRLKNGKTLTADIVSERDDQIVLNVSGVAMGFKRNEIVAIADAKDQLPLVEVAPSEPAPPPEPVAPPPPREQPCVVDSRTIEQIDFELYISYGAVSGWAVFRDKQHRFCGTNGHLTIKKIVTASERHTVYDTPTTSHDENVPVESEETVKSVSFKASEFQDIKMRNGTLVYGLPLEIPGSELKRDDVAILEWRSFAVKKKVY